MRDLELGMKLALLSVMAVIHYLGAAPFGPLLSWPAAILTYYAAAMILLAKREHDRFIRWVWIVGAIPLIFANITNTLAFLSGHTFRVQEIADIFAVMHMGTIGPAFVMAARNKLAS